MDISTHMSSIKYLNPLKDSGIKFDALRWGNLNNEYKNYIAEHQDKFISRQIVIESYVKFYIGEHPWETPFLLTMIWGFGNAGYGTHRTNLYLSTEKNQT